MTMQQRPSHGHWPQRPADHRVVVLGASPKPARYAFKALKMLQDGGYTVIPVHPKVAEIEGVAVAPDLRVIDGPVHTLTLYVGPQRSAALHDDILALNPGRVIFNPGTESPTLEQALRHRGVECIEGCTLVMLRTHQF